MVTINFSTKSHLGSLSSRFLRWLIYFHRVSMCLGLYHDQCTQTIWKHAIEHFQKSSSLSCPQNNTHTQTWQRHLNELKLKISNDVSILSDLDKVFSQMHPLYQDSCCNAFLKWKDQLKEDFDRQMKNLEYFRELHRAKIGGQAFRPSWGR
ncbi:hypothetical protein K435DRAFT_423665 [Dendrothele bispora CBS 962.96]|uniref:Uncharacterized protein n=1 Tax=Dendrothele bispora (strain CBS 962.96) TaxID=1314807 RepID=A0A4S8L573_DENBC|nr:hypothetical protein K435DRAFT_423665 [Dendrothele bispora CBS 962.96]